MASGDIILPASGEYTLVAENETGQNSTTVTLDGYVGGVAKAVQVSLEIKNSNVGWTLGESPFRYGKTYTLVVTEN